VIHIRITYWRRDDGPFIYFVIFVSMDEKTECRSLYFLVSILRGIIFIQRQKCIVMYTTV
jgi:hypothetical protein